VFRLLKKNIKLLSMIGLTILGVGLMYGLVHLGLISPSVNSAVIQPENINYVLVNEDLGGVFNDQEHNLGAEFVNLINQDQNRRWHTASRSVATAGLQAGSYDVKIILPQNFSERLLSLQSFTPEQAQIIFEVRAGQNDLVNAAILENVSEILSDFNIRIIQMYFSSILNNIYEAQRNVESMITTEQEIKNTLIDAIHLPFTELPNSFSSTIEQSEQLADSNRNWQEQQENFTGQTQELLETTAGELAARLEQLAEYMEMLQQMNQSNLETTTAAMEHQSGADEEFYRGIFDNLNRTGIEHFRGFRSENEEGDLTGVMADLENVRNQFSDTQTAGISAIIRQTGKMQADIQKLHDLADELAALQGDIAEAYFSGRSLTPSTATEENVRTAILALERSTGDVVSRLDSAYLDRLHSDISNLALSDLEAILSVLNVRGLINNALLAEYVKSLAIVKRYATEEGLVTGGQPFVLLGTADEEYPDSAEFNKTVLLGLSTGGNNVITANSRSSSIAISTSDANLGSIKSEIDTHLSVAGFPSWSASVSASGADIIITFSGQQPCGCVPGDTCLCYPDNPDPCTCPQIPTIPDSFAIPVDITLSWWFSSAEKANIYNFADYSLSVNGSEVLRRKLFKYVNLEHANLEFLYHDLEPLLNQVKLLESVARQIILIFGPSDENRQTTSGFYDHISQFIGLDANGDAQTIRSIALPQSVYLRVGVLSDEERRELIANSLVELFRERGTELFDNVDGQYIKLRETILAGESEIELLNELFEDIPSPETLLDEVNQVIAWQEAARAALEEAHNAWTESPAVPLRIAEYSMRDSVSEDELIVFTDSTVGMGLFSEMSLLMTGTISHAEMTALAAASIESLDERFESLIAQTGLVKGDADVVLESMGNLLDEYAAAVEQNAEFSENFSTVMENARVGGSENRQVHQFLADPMIPLGIFGASETTSMIPYFMTVIGVLLSLAVGYSLRYVETKRKIREEHKMLTPSRIWFNTPEVVKVSAIAVLIGVAFGVVTIGTVPFVRMPSWIIYATLVTLASILLVAFFARQFPKLALYVILALIGMYLLLTPILGMTIAPDSFVEVLFQFSLLQNVENGYMQLVRGASVGWLTYLVLFLLVSGGILLNLIVKKKKAEVEAS